jgi:hypothetical protein
MRRNQHVHVTSTRNSWILLSTNHVFCKTKFQGCVLQSKHVEWKCLWMTTNGARLGGEFHWVTLSWGWHKISLPVTDRLHPGQRMLNPVTANGGGTCAALACITCRTTGWRFVGKRTKAYKRLSAQWNERSFPQLSWKFARVSVWQPRCQHQWSRRPGGCLTN